MVKYFCRQYAPHNILKLLHEVLYSTEKTHGRKWRSITVVARHWNRSNVQSTEERIMFVIDEREAPVRKTGARAGVVC